MEHFRIVIDNKNAIFQPGQSIIGRVIIADKKLKKTKKLIIGIKGEAKSNWNEAAFRISKCQDGDMTYSCVITYSKEETYINKEKMAYEAVNMKLKSGKHVFPFSFDLPLKCYPSYEGDDGHIKYYVYTELEKLDGAKPKKVLTEYFNVGISVDLNTVPLAILPLELTTDQDKKQPINMMISIPKRGFVYGEDIPISVTIDNKSGNTVDEMRVELLQEGIFNGELQKTNNTDQFTEDIEDTKESSYGTRRLIWKEKQKMNVMGHKTSNVLFLLKVPNVSVEFPPSFDSCPVLSVQYFIRVKLSTDVIFGSNIKQDIPIIIGTVPIKKLSITCSVSSVASENSKENVKKHYDMNMNICEPVVGRKISVV